MTDYYDLLGIDADAGKDEIRSAYRDRLEGASQSERAKLNKAWNVLSDPVQRGRYDEDAMGETSGDGADGTDRDEGDDEGDDAPVPARFARSTKARGERPARTRQPARPPLEPTIELPRGLAFADKRSRNLALLFDFAVILIIFLGCQYAGAAIIGNQYPAETDRVEALAKQIDKADEAQSKADDAQDKAEKNKDTAAAAEAKQESKAAEKQSKALSKDLTDAQSKLAGPYFVLILFVLAVALLYVVPMSAKTGQTLGKKRQRIRLVRLDGSPPGLVASLTHYGVPLALALLLFGLLGPLALILGLGMVLWNLRDRNRQGLHDKLAKTLVVADTD